MKRYIYVLVGFIFLLSSITSFAAKGGDKDDPAKPPKKALQAAVPAHKVLEQQAL